MMSSDERAVYFLLTAKSLLEGGVAVNSLQPMKISITITRLLTEFKTYLSTCIIFYTMKWIMMVFPFFDSEE